MGASQERILRILISPREKTRHNNALIELPWLWWTAALHIRQAAGLVPSSFSYKKNIRQEEIE